MNVVPLTKDRYKDWDRFCLESRDAWFWHTTDFIDYSLDLRPNLQSLSESFLILDNNGDIVGICPLLVETAQWNGQVIKEFSFGGAPLPTPAIKNVLARKRAEEVLGVAFNSIDLIASKHSVQRGTFRFSPLAPSFTESHLPKHNFLKKYGYLDISLDTHAIDLSLPIESMWREVRKGHAHDIKRGAKVLEVIVYDSSSIEDWIFSCYKAMHHKASGRATRPDSTFEMMHKWICQGNGILVAASLGEKLIAFALFILYKGRAYYGSAANDPDAEYENLPMGHVLQWATIKWLKDNSYSLYEIGYQQFGNQLHDLPSRKELNLSLFKRGFGGITLPMFVSEKYYSNDFLRSVYELRLKELLANENTQG